MNSQELLETISRDVVDLKRDMVDLKRILADLSLHSPMRLGQAANGMKVASESVPKANTPVRISGVVLSEAKKPLQGTAITIYDAATSQEIAKAVSDTNGEWHAQVPKTGPYSIEYVRGGKAPHNINIIIPPGVASYSVAKGR